MDIHLMELNVKKPGGVKADASVLKVQFENNMQVETRIIEDDSGCIELPACLAPLT